MMFNSFDNLNNSLVTVNIPPPQAPRSPEFRSQDQGSSQYLE